jgi:hypothetical protein
LEVSIIFQVRYQEVSIPEGAWVMKEDPLVEISVMYEIPVVGALNNRSFSNASSSRESAIKIILYI